MNKTVLQGLALVVTIVYVVKPIRTNVAES